MSLRKPRRHRGRKTLFDAPSPSKGLPTAVLRRIAPTLGGVLRKGSRYRAPGPPRPETGGNVREYGKFVTELRVPVRWSDFSVAPGVRSHRAAGGGGPGSGPSTLLYQSATTNRGATVTFEVKSRSEWRREHALRLPQRCDPDTSLPSATPSTRIGIVPRARPSPLSYARTLTSRRPISHRPRSRPHRHV